VESRRLSRDILGVFGTRVAWTLMSMVTGVILARKLGPHDRGVFALILLAPSTVVTFVKLGIAQSNVYFINRKREPIEKVAANCVALAVVFGLGAGALVWVCKGTLLTSILRGVEPWALALALVRVPLLLLDDYLYGVLQAAGSFHIYNKRLVISEAVRMVLVITALLIFHFGLAGAVWIYTLVNAANIVWLMGAMHRRIPFTLGVHWGLLGQQLSFGVKSYVQTLTAHALLRSDVYMVSYFLGPTDTAFYSLALRFSEMILEIPQAVGLVLYPRLATLPKDEVHRLTAQACRRTLLLTGLGVVIVSLFGPYLLTLWYGAAYTAAGAPLPWAAVGVLAMSIFVILTRDFTSRNRQQVNIAAGIVALVSNVLLNLYMIPTMGIVGAAMSTAISYSGACLLLVAFYLFDSQLPLFDIILAKPEDLRFFWGLIRQVAARGWRLTGLGSVTTGH
jgi:O-antigen/teichoic acid export membrane protein